MSTSKRQYKQIGFSQKTIFNRMLFRVDKNIKSFIQKIFGFWKNYSFKYTYNSVNLDLQFFNFNPFGWEES